MEKLMDKLTNVVSASRLKWIRTRVVRMYSYWEKAKKEFESRVNITDKPVKKVSSLTTLADCRWKEASSILSVYQRTYELSIY